MWMKKENQEEKKGGPHPDYEYNLSYSERFVKQVEGKLPLRMRVTIADSHALSKVLLMISWMPPMSAKMGNYATPVFMHQSRNEFTKKVSQVFDNYIGMIRDFEAKNPPKAEEEATA